MDLVPFDPWESVEISQGNLPHWQQRRRTYFITWRTADSIPTEVLKVWHHDHDIWLRVHQVTLDRLGTLPPKKQMEYHERFTLPWNAHLDSGHGECLLQRGDVRALVEQTLRHFDTARYDLGNFVLMPNHVHLLVTPHEGQDIKKLCFSWKRYSAGRINELLGKSGEFWQSESYDHIVRHAGALAAIQRYIELNPENSRLTSRSFTLYQPPKWSQAK